MSTELDEWSHISKIDIERLGKKIDALSDLTFTNNISLWIKNYRLNLPITWGIPKELREKIDRYVEKSETKSILDIKPITKKNKAAIIVGAGPSLTDDQIKELKNFEGTIITTNKSLKRLLDFEVIPDWVVALDSQEVVFDSFTPEIVKKYAKNINALLITSIHPKVANFVVDNFKEVYWGNAVIPLERGKNIDMIMYKTNDMIITQTGGNCSSFGYLLAIALKCNPVGLLGVDMSVKPNPTWTLELNKLYTPYYNPNANEIYCVSDAVIAYITLLIKYIELTRTKNKIDTINLTPRGPLYASDKLKYMLVNEFVDKTNINTEFRIRFCSKCKKYRTDDVEREVCNICLNKERKDV